MKAGFFLSFVLMKNNLKVNWLSLNMKFWFLLLLLTSNCFCQELLIEDIDDLVGVDIYENIYYLQNGNLHKSNINNDYLNIKYGTPDLVDISNPLQILILYKLFNKVVCLDNQLSYITEFEVPFGTEFICNAGQDKIWLYENINMMLKLYNFKTKKTEINSIPIQQNILKMRGNLNEAILLDDQGQLIRYNYLARPKNTQYLNQKQIPLSLTPQYYLKEGSLYLRKNKILSSLKGLNQFEVVNNHLYFFKENNIYRFSIPKN